MADQLTGRALDEAAAIAMGHSTKARGRGRKKEWWQFDETFQFWGDLRPYSTDLSHSPEMLTWLPERISITRCGFVTASTRLRYIGLVTAVGDTLPEALARLVVEVARARGQR